MNFIRTAILLFLLQGAFNGYAQTDRSFLSRAVSSLEKYSATSPVEKVHLHLDRTDYSPGDTIWFKAYTVAGQNHGLSAISKILHVELLTGYDSVVNRIAIPLSDGVGWADFALPVLIKTGNYHVRAYTNWMRNFAPDYFFDQAIQVKEVEATSTQKKQKRPGEPDVQFFAEGGALVNGLRTKIAVKAVGTNGLGEDIDGSVVDDDGNEVAVFSTQHLGMGVFALIPQVGKTYKAKITSKNGGQFTAKLPKAQDDGFAIAVNNAMPDSISIRVASSPKLFETKKGAKYYLVGQSGGKVYFTAALTLSSPSFSTQIDKKRFPTGIAQFTLFAENNEPLNERIVFIQHDDGLKLKITSVKKTYGARQKVDITLNATNAVSKPVVGSFSAAVINQDINHVNEADENGILSSLLLTADIKGYIEQPGYYFTNTSNKFAADLDLLMLTQGYHRFEWKNIFDKTPPGLIYESESSLSVSGYLKAFGGKPVANGKIMLYSLKGGWFRLDTVTNQDGRFIFNGLIPNPDTTLKYVVQGRTATDKKRLNVTLDTIASFIAEKKVDIHASTLDTIVQTAYQKQIKQQIKISLDKRIIPLKEVIIKEAAVRRTHDGQIARSVIKIPEEDPGGTLAQYLASRVSGILFMDGTPYNYSSIKATPAGHAPAPTAIMQDGLPIDPAIFSTLSLTGIESVENYGGMLNLISRKHFTYKREVTPDVITFSSIGLYKAKEFYAPKYDKVTESNLTPDLRNTIYWKPDMITDKDGNASLSFYNADTRGTYRVTIEGVDVDGNLGRQVYTYTVE